MAVGFASLGSFSARFSQLVGESPTAYRVMRDNTGNWLVLVEPREFSPQDFK